MNGGKERRNRFGGKVLRKVEVIESEGKWRVLLWSEGGTVLPPRMK